MARVKNEESIGGYYCVFDCFCNEPPLLAYFAWPCFFKIERRSAACGEKKEWMVWSFALGDDVTAGKERGKGARIGKC